MMSIIFNRVGVRTFLATLLITGLLGVWMWMFDKECFLSCGTVGCLMGSGVFMLLFDFWYRMAHGECSLLQPRRGGHLFFIPVWILGGVCIVASLCESPSLILGMISGVSSNRIATVNGQPFAEGESHTVTIGSAKRMVQCTKIREKSVVVTLDGDSKQRELKIGEPVVCRR
jgi:hypothetical protein